MKWVIAVLWFDEYERCATSYERQKSTQLSSMTVEIGFSDNSRKLSDFLLLGAQNSGFPSRRLATAGTPSSITIICENMFLMLAWYFTVRFRGFRVPDHSVGTLTLNSRGKSQIPRLTNILFVQSEWLDLWGNRSKQILNFRKRKKSKNIVSLKRPNLQS